MARLSYTVVLFASISSFCYATDNAQVEINEPVQLMSIDGVETNTGIFSREHNKITLSAGEHILGVRYNQLFQLNADEHDILKSPVINLHFMAEAGHLYHCEITPPKRYDAAREFAKHPEISLVDAQTQQKTQGSLAPKTSTNLTDSINKALQATDNDTPSSVAVMQQLWLQSSAKDRKAFREWLNQQP